MSQEQCDVQAAMAKLKAFSGGIPPRSGCGADNRKFSELNSKVIAAEQRLRASRKGR
jgi:hypothetical protein